MTKTAQSAIALAILGLYSLFLILFALDNPLYTWDTVPYLASALSFQISDPVALHAATYELLAQNLSPQQFAALTGGDYAGNLYGSATNFQSQLDLYFIKPLYVFCLQILVVAGVPPLSALVLMSALPGALICLILFLWLRRQTAPLNALLLVIFFSIAARITDLSRVPVPDNLSAAIMLTGLYALVVWRRTALATLLLCATVLIRPNNIIYVVLVLAYQIWAYRAPVTPSQSGIRTWSAGGLLLALSSYLALNLSFDYQWWRLFYHTFVTSQVNIDNFTQSFSLATYLDVVLGAVSAFFSGGGQFVSSLPLFLVLLICGLIRHPARLGSVFLAPRPETGLAALVLLSLPVFAAFILLFPSVPDWDRFYVPFYALFLIYALSGETAVTPGTEDKAG